MKCGPKWWQRVSGDGSLDLSNGVVRDSCRADLPQLLEVGGRCAGHYLVRRLLAISAVVVAATASNVSRPSPPRSQCVR